MGKKRNKTGEKANIFETVRTQGVEIYLFLMLCVYPLFMGKGYGELIYRKWALFLYATMAFVAVSAVTGCAAAAVGRSHGIWGWLHNYCSGEFISAFPGDMRS